MRPPDEQLDLSPVTMDGDVMCFKFAQSLALILIGFSAHASILDLPVVALCRPGFESGRRVDENLLQRTGTSLKIGDVHSEFAQFSDPAPPYVNLKGEVELHGPGDYYIRYANWQEFERGGCFEKVPLVFLDEDKQEITNTLLQPWDARKFRVIENGRTEEVLVGSVMTGKNGGAPTWPDDNFSRRIYTFRANKRGQWIRSPEPITGELRSRWLGHSYGGNILQENSTDSSTIDFRHSNATGFFYERVSDATNDFPQITELFVRRLDSIDKAVGPELPVFKMGANPYPATRRSIGGFLAEGPRPIMLKIDGKRIYLVAFSSADFPTDYYTINFVWSRSLFGPYKPILTDDQKDLEDFGAKLRSRYNLSWLGRPSPYVKPDGSLGLLFHGVIRDLVPNFDYNHWPSDDKLEHILRLLFDTTMTVELNSKGEPDIEVAD